MVNFLNIKAHTSKYQLSKGHRAVEVKHCSHLFNSHFVNNHQCISSPLLRITVTGLEDFYYKDK